MLKTHNIMTTFRKSLMPLQAKRVKENSRITVVIRVFHSGKSGYIVTGIDVGCTLVKSGRAVPNFAKGMISTLEPEWVEKNKALDKSLKIIEERYAHIINPGLLTCTELCDLLREDGLPRSMQPTIRQAAKDYVELKRGVVSANYITMVEKSLSRFVDWAPGELFLSDIDSVMLQTYRKYLQKLTTEVEEKEAYYSVQYKQTRYHRRTVIKKALSEASVNKELAHIKAVINYAIEANMVRYATHPFAEVTIQRSAAKENDVAPEIIRQLRDAEIKVRRLDLARDVFMLSFYLGGINYRDIWEADFSQNVVTYCRKKTQNSSKVRRIIKVPILPEARAILDKWTDENGKWDARLYFTDPRDEIGYIGRQLKKVVKNLRLPSCMSFYSARKSFAQYALDLGISDAVTGYLMGHSDASRGVISYYSRVTPRMAGIALRKVIDYMNNPDEYLEDVERAIMS